MTVTIGDLDTIYSTEEAAAGSSGCTRHALEVHGNNSAVTL